MNRRRGFLAGAVLLLVATRSFAQRTDKPRRIGYLGVNSAAVAQPLLEMFRLGLRQLGWTEGADFVIEGRYADGKVERLVELATELVNAKVEVIVTPTEPLVQAAKLATTTIPIVMVAAGDPVASGLVSSLARPGGNVTGLSFLAPDLDAKRLQLLREAVPRLSRVAVLWNAGNPAHPKGLLEITVAARALGMSVQSRPVRGPDPRLSEAFAAALGEQAQALTVFGDAFMFGQRWEIAARANATRLPLMWDTGSYMDAGGLISYGPSVPDDFRRAAGYVDKILKGAKPADLPVEQPTRFELIVNLKNAKVLGITVPQSVLLRADRVIE